RRVPTLLSGEERVVGGRHEPVVALSPDPHGGGELATSAEYSAEPPRVGQGHVPHGNLLDGDETPLRGDHRACREAGGSADEKIDSCIVILLDGGEVAVERHVGEVVLEYGTGEGVDLAEERRTPAQRVPCHGCRFNSRTHAAVDQRACVSCRCGC